DPLRADVEAGDVGTGRDDAVERRVGSPVARLLADDLHQTAPFQPGERLRGGDLGEPGQLTDLPPGQRPGGEQQLEGGPVVDLPQQPRHAWTSHHAPARYRRSPSSLLVRASDGK